MNKFANEKDNNNNADVKKNMEQSLENANKSNSNLSSENEYNIKPIIEQIIAKGIKEWHPKHPLNSTLVPNNVNQIINQKNKFDFNSVRSFSLQKIVQHKSTNRTNSNINYPKFDIKADPFFPKDIIKNNFNIVVSEAIKNHETEPLFRVDGNDFVVDDKSFAFGKTTQTKLTINKVIDKLWKSYIEKKNIKICDTKIFELSLLSTKCILSDENKNKLYKLFNDAEKKALDEQEKNLEKEIIEKKKRNDIKQKLSKQADVLINDIYKCENNYIVCGEDGERYHDKNHLNGEYTNFQTCRATSMLIKEKLINSFLNPEDKSVITNEELNKIVDEVVESKKNKIEGKIASDIEGKIASDIENRKQVLKDFNDFVSREIDKHSYERVMYQYDYEKQKFFLPPNEFYDTVDDLETALIKIYAKRYSEHKNTEKSYNPFDSNPYSLNVDSIEVLDDITKRKLDDSISMIFKNRLDELSKIFNNSCKSDVHKFISNLLGDFWIIKINDRQKRRTIKEIKKVILNNFIDRLEQPKKTKYRAIPYDCLGSISISPIYLDYIFGSCFWSKLSWVDFREVYFLYYDENDIDSNNFDAKFDELRKEYGAKNISPIAACYFLSAIKKDDLTTYRLDKVWNEVNADLYYSFSSCCSPDQRLIFLINNLMDGNLISDKHWDILIFCLKIYLYEKHPDYIPEILYKVIYDIITNSENYKQANGDKEKETAAIKKFFDPNGSFKEFWITLGELNADMSPCYKSPYSEMLTMRKMKELARDSKNEYSYKLSNLLSDHDIYISPTIEKTKDDKGKEVDQICIKVDSYKQTKENAQNGFNEYMKKLIDDLKNDQNVKYDWAEGTLTYNEKIIYNFKNVKFYDEEGKKCDAANETLQFVVLVAEFYCQDHKLPFYGFDLSLQTNDMREIQKIVGEKQQAKIKELIDGFSEFVDEKIENHNKQKELLFVIKEGSICNYKYNAQELYDFGMVNDLANEIVEQFITEYFRNKFYINDNTKRLIQKEIEEQENKLKTLFNNAIKEHVEKNKLNYEYDAREDYWKEIPEKNIKEKVKQQANPENKKLNDVKKESVINLNQKSKIENKDENEQDNKIKEEITEENIDENDLEALVLEALVNEALQKAKESLIKEKNEAKSEEHSVMTQNNNPIENKIYEKQNDKSDNNATEIENKIRINKKTDEYDLTYNQANIEIANNDLENKSEVGENQQKNIDSSKTEKENKDKPKENDILVPNGINIDENKNQNEIGIKNMEKNNENGTKNDTSGELSDEDKIVEDNDKIDKNRIEENSNNIKSQTDSAGKNNPNESETKNKGWIKFLTVLKWIALIGFILASVMTAVSIFAEILPAATIKFVIAVVVFLFVFVVSELFISCLSDKKMKENKNPYPEQINTCIKQKENQNEFNINNLVNNELNTNQIGEQEKNNVSSIEDSLD